MKLKLKSLSCPLALLTGLTLTGCNMAWDPTVVPSPTPAAGITAPLSATPAAVAPTTGSTAPTVAPTTPDPTDPSGTPTTTKQFAANVAVTDEPASLAGGWIEAMRFSLRREMQSASSLVTANTTLPADPTPVPTPSPGLKPDAAAAAAAKATDAANAAATAYYQAHHDDILKGLNALTVDDGFSVALAKGLPKVGAVSVLTSYTAGTANQAPVISVDTSQLGASRGLSKTAMLAEGMRLALLSLAVKDPDPAVLSTIAKRLEPTRPSFKPSAVHLLATSWGGGTPHLMQNGTTLVVGRAVYDLEHGNTVMVRGEPNPFANYFPSTDQEMIALPEGGFALMKWSSLQLATFASTDQVTRVWGYNQGTETVVEFGDKAAAQSIDVSQMKGVALPSFVPPPVGVRGFSPNGHYIGYSSNTDTSNGVTLEFRDRLSGRSIGIFNGFSAPTAIHISFDGRYAAVVDTHPASGSSDPKATIPTTVILDFHAKTRLLGIEDAHFIGFSEDANHASKNALLMREPGATGAPICQVTFADPKACADVATEAGNLVQAGYLRGDSSRIFTRIDTGHVAIVKLAPAAGDPKEDDFNQALATPATAAKTTVARTGSTIVIMTADEVTGEVRLDTTSVTPVTETPEPNITVPVAPVAPAAPVTTPAPAPATPPPAATPANARRGAPVAAHHH